ncbi:MAG TPA: FHA domain-containing protein [Bellilinea sp.]|nr:FHA domain-containing protein [Bellilinea sp.]
MMFQADAESPIIIGQSGLLNGDRWEVSGELLIGRDESCQIVIRDRQVSRYHARVSVNDDGVISIEDLGSKNGTYINGAKVEEKTELSDGDSFQIAMLQSFVFLSSDSTMPLGPGIPLEQVPSGGERGERRLYLDSLSRRVYIDGLEVLPALSVQQFRLLEILYEQPGMVVSREEIVDRVWGQAEAIGVSEQALDALIRRLRERLSLVDDDHVFLITVRGYGLRLDNPLKNGA